jgi:xylulokinase
MNFLAIDAGSSSVKARLFKGGKPAGRLARVAYPTEHDGLRVEVQPRLLLAAVAKTVEGMGRADLIGLSVMSPAWVAMDRRGNAITPIVTHQDRRSLAEARELEKRVGAARHLRLAGNRPYPGSISSTTCAWFGKHEPALLKRADLIGHLNTFLIRRLTGERVIDPSNASFTGLYLTCGQSGWSDELCRAAGVSPSQMPRVMESDQIAGTVTPAAAAAFGLRAGTPVLAGMVDTSAAFLLTDRRAGQLFNVCGSTDVLAVICDKARPHPRLLTRAYGIGRKWISAATIAAAGSALAWMHAQFFGELSDAEFHQLTTRLSGRHLESPVRFEPYLAGERASVEQKTAAFSNLTLATTREQMLAAVIESLISASAARLPLLAEAQNRFLPSVFVSGGGEGFARLMHRDWPALSLPNGPGRGWRYRYLSEAPLSGLATLSS